MQLTEEQHRLIEAAGGQPIDVVDPQSNRAYILVPAELYQRVRVAFPEVAMPPAREARKEPHLGKLRDLPLPPDVAEEARRYCKQLGLWGRKYIQEVEDELMFQYYFGGEYVVYLRSKDGPIVVAAGRLESEEFGRQLDAVPSEYRRKVVYLLPSVWKDTASELRTPLDSYDD